MSSKDVLVVNQLTKVFPSYEKKGALLTAVNGISFSLEQGQILGLLGSNGAGKTTTIQMLLSTLSVTSGSIVYFGKNFFTHRSTILQHVGFASTYVSMPANLTVFENLIVHGMLYGLGGEELKKRIESFLGIFGVWEMRLQDVCTLSAGQKTRVMLAKAFMTYPKIVLLDEPTASLDPDIAKEVRKFILQQQRELGVSIIFTSHNMNEVTEICDRVLVMQKGSIIAYDTPESLAAGVSTAHVQLMVGDDIHRVITYADEKEYSYTVKDAWITFHIDESKISTLFSDFAQAKLTYTQISIDKPTLEDYFLYITKNKG